jgi:hypothetical protein
MLAATMAHDATAGGAQYDRRALDRGERLFWREIWESVPAGLARERGVELRDFGPVQATMVRELPGVGMMNLVLGATEPGAVEEGHFYVPVTPDLPESGAAESLLSLKGFDRGYAWMKFIRDPHPPRFKAPDVEIVELTDPVQEPFGMIAATGFEMPAWASAFFADLPGREGWRCYAARVDGEAQACGAMRIHAGVAELGVGATLEPARGRGCQLALLHRRIADAVEAGCHTLFVETGKRVPDRPNVSYRNILRAGFEEAYLRPNWRRKQ